MSGSAWWSWPPAPWRRGRGRLRRAGEARLPAPPTSPAERPELVDAEAEGGDEDDRDRLRSDLLHAEPDQPAQEQEVQPERDRRHDQKAGALVVDDPAPLAEGPVPVPPIVVRHGDD